MKCYRCNSWDGKQCECPDGITLFHGDCREILPQLPKVDLVLTDPPYGIGLESHGQRFDRADIEVAGDGDLEAARFVYDFSKSEGLPLAMFYSPFRPLSGWRSILVWDKGPAVGIGGDKETCWKRTFELIGVANNRELNGPRSEAVLRYEVHSGSFNFHPCQKPNRLMTYLLMKLTEPGELALDAYCGSGTTLLAAKRTNRRAIGIEIEEKYVQICCNRLRQSVLPFGD